jgi:uncharacterized membrane protein (DUF485 family)
MTSPSPQPDAAVAAPAAHRTPTPDDFAAAHRSEEFRLLRRSFRAFAFPMTVAFLVWYLSYVLLSTYAEGLMSAPVIGNLNVGLLLGLSQFVMTFLITWLYIRHANRSLDPVASTLRDELEGDR